MSNCSKYFNVNKIKELYNTQKKIHEENIENKFINDVPKNNEQKIKDVLIDINKNEEMKQNNGKKNKGKTKKSKSLIFSYNNEKNLIFPCSFNTPISNRSSVSTNMKNSLNSNKYFDFNNNSLSSKSNKSIKINKYFIDKKKIKKYRSYEDFNFNEKENNLKSINSLNKYDFIRYVCSPKKTKDVERINKKNSFYTENEKNECNIKMNYINLNDENSKIKENNFIKSQNYMVDDDEIKIIDEIKEKKKIVIDIENYNKDTEEINMDFTEDKNKSYLVDKLSTNFFINNKKFFINDLNNEKLYNSYEKQIYNMYNETNNQTSNIKSNNSFNNTDDNINNTNKYVQDINKTKRSELNLDKKNINNEYNIEYNEINDYENNSDIEVINMKKGNENNYFNNMKYIKKNCKMWKCLYSYLDVNYNCNKEDLKRAYKEKIKQHHPDKGGNINNFLEIKLSYDILMNDKKRKLYDKYGNSILELLISEKYISYDVLSCDEKNEIESDEECFKIYELFVLKYKNVSYLNNLNELKIDKCQYNEFQNLLFNFFNMKNTIFKNIFYIYPIYSQHITPITKSSTLKKNSENKKKKKKNIEKEKNNKESDIKEKYEENDFSTIFENTFREDSLNFSTKSSSNYTYLHTDLNIIETNKKKIKNMFNDLNLEFKFFCENQIKENIENDKEDSIKNENVNKYNDENFFINQCETPNQFNQHNNLNRNQNLDDFFENIQVSPLLSRIIYNTNEKNVKNFYKWFEYLNKSYETFTSESNMKKNNIKSNNEVIDDNNEYSDSDIEIIYKTSNSNLKKKNNENKIDECTDEYIKQIKKRKIVENKIEKEKDKKNNKEKNNIFNSSINNKCITDMYNKKYTQNILNKNYETLNIEEKYGFNLIKKKHKINDLTHNFNYIYVGNNICKKKNFLLFIKEESIKNFLKIKLLIKKIEKNKKQSNLKLISFYENKIHKKIKYIEYIILLITNKEDLIPLNDFYLLDKNKYNKDYYCIPIYIKKNNILRPNFYEFKWIIYIIKSLIFFVFFFNKVNKYICIFPFFNYKYNFYKNYIENKEKEEKNLIKNNLVSNTYIFFQSNIIKNKNHYLKYFPHSLFFSFKNYESINNNCQNLVQVNLSPIFILTPNNFF